MREVTDLKLQTLSRLENFIQFESDRQIYKWGIQNRTPAEWMLYLTEEVGELAEAISEREYRSGLNDDIIKEAIQVATLALKIAEIYLVEEDEKRGNNP
jgi:NTP pyrophosphatase (non-canonical NTP hydrolase)